VERTQGIAQGARRHPTLDRLEGGFGAIARATAAATVDAGNGGGLVMLPTVIWMDGPDGHAKAHRGLLPYPVRWNVPLVVKLAPERRMIVRWTAGAWGVQCSGELELICSTVAPTVCSIADVSTADRVPARVWVGVGSAERLRWHLEDIREQASEARWALHEVLAPWLRQSMTAAHRAVAADLQVRRCLDDAGLDELFAEIELGTADAPGLIAKVVDRLADVTKSRPSVDAARYIVTTFRRDAELALRRRVDDPRWLGTAFRNFARQHPHLEGRELVAAFNDSGCMSERIGVARAMRALRPAVAPEQVELLPERAGSLEVDAGPEVAHVATALRRAFSERGGITGAARTITSEGPGEHDEHLLALAKVAGTKRTLLRLATMEESAAASWVAARLVTAGAA
jgi:hypothetical protein